MDKLFLTVLLGLFVSQQAACFEFEDRGILPPCRYSCLNGNQPVAKQNYTAEVNGCGSFNINFDFSYFKLENFNECCNKHDVCYRTCNSDKKICDLQFSKCLSNECDNKYKNKRRGLFSSITTSIKYKMCQELGEKLYDTVDHIGCPSFLKDQKISCDC